MERHRATFIRRLDRLGLLKYALAGLLAAMAFSLTAGAYLYEERGRRPPPLPAGFRIAEPPAAPAPPASAMRAPAVRDVRFATAPEGPGGFSFYDITALETPRTLADKLVRRHFRVSRGKGETCNFAYPLAGPAGAREAVAAFIREQSRQCCAVAALVPGQLATYSFALADGQASAKTGPVSGTAVFSQVGAGLLTLNLRFSENVDGYAAALGKHLRERLGQPAPFPGDGSAWARDGGFVTMVRNGRSLSVTAYYGANIERHAALAAKLADRPSRPPAEPTASRLAAAAMP